MSTSGLANKTLVKAIASLAGVAGIITVVAITPRQPSQLTFTDTSPQTTRPALTTTTEPTTTQPPIPLNLDCPEPVTGDWGTYRAEFDFSIRGDVAGFTGATIDYGDDRTYSSDTMEDAERNMFWHDFAEPDTYLVRLSVSHRDGQVYEAKCYLEG